MTARPVSDDRHNSWRDDAACLDHPTEWFTGPHEPGDTRRAIDVCDTCPVKQPCLEAALSIEASADLGIWGGTTPTTRRALRRGQLDREWVLQAADRKPSTPDPKPSSSTVEEGHRKSALEGSALLRDAYGDYVDESGRVIVFRIHGTPPLMVMVDRRPRFRVHTLDEAQALAYQLLRESQAAETRWPQRT